ncbi:TIGR01777 family oxidoreductase [Thiosulfativibrio zosterae]|uniref:Epimerase n=1 Tax=Thiosulfativibrio zosterae TaxID=2675053 RepID=A0A6F8PMD5_9GAMM|nr:TIGR01777 family oxidoreductase [Thiosulfativibrio zosterae]BBP43160.1 epimerase [Thiosulfativibrio zosterae]
MKICILGGTGFIGHYLTNYFSQQFHQVKALGRQAFAPDFDLTSTLNGQDLVIMLAGANVGERWSKQHKQALWDSRLNTNARLAQALSQCKQPPARIFSASAIGIYPQNSCTNLIDETCTEIGEGVLGQLGKAWEEASLKLLPKPLILRFGVVLGKNGGALAKMLPPFKMGLGGPVAGGQQCFSWIHLEDLARIMSFAIEHPELEGPINVTAPNPVSNAVFGASLAKALHRPFWLPLPEWQLKLMFGEGAQVLTHSSAIVPQRLLDAGFEFTYPQIDDALKACV